MPETAPAMRTSTFNGISVPAYDYVGVTYPLATTEQFVLRRDNSTGMIVATLLLTYSDATKSNLISVEKT
jgi:hypothetical protein